MDKRRGYLIFMVLAVALVALPWGIAPAHAADGGAAGMASLQAGDHVAQQNTWYANSPQPDPLNPDLRPVGQNANPSGQPIRKFITSLPGLTSAYKNEIGQYIPIATKDTTTYPGSDFYRMNIVEFTEQLHPDLPKKTRLRGYVDASSPATLANPHYLGPLVIAQRFDSTLPPGQAGNGKPVRLLVKNSLPIGAAGNLFIPVDGLLMGAGMGPDGDPTKLYSQNRACFHLHGGFTPWISDGTAHQWFTPAGTPNFANWKANNGNGPFKYNTPFSNLKGASFQNVPDMVGSGKSILAAKDGDGLATYYYTNAQSARLMFYHDHALGMTRLNVYAGEAAGYLLTDSFEETLINSGTFPNQGGIPVYRYGIPLIIQDKTFVPQNIATQDNAWGLPSVVGGANVGGTPNWGTYGDLWFPHKLEPNQDRTAIIGHKRTGASLFGRWDYGPWFWPVQLTNTGPLTVATRGQAHLLPGEATNFSNPWAYNNCIVPEAFMDTPMVNGNPYPYLDVQPTSYRFRVLNACNDRNLNLSMFVADTGGAATSADPVTHALSISGGATATATVISLPTAGPVTSLALVAGSALYTSAPNVYLYGGGGTGAAATVGLTPGPVASIAVTNGGTGYTTAPTVTLSGGGLAGGTPTTATATVTNGSVDPTITLTPGTGTYTDAPLVSFTGGGGTGATAMAALTAGPIASITLTDGGTGYTGNPTVLIGSPTEIKMVESCLTLTWPSTWPQDSRDGGVPDPALRGPNVIQVGTEAGLLAAPALIPSQPVNYEYNRRDIVVLNVTDKGLFMGPAERADIIVDFSAFAGKTIILYNDAPAPVPAFDPRYDYYTGNPDQLVNGGGATTLPGYGPNTRTIMQFRVANAAPVGPYNLAGLQAALPATFALSQDKPIVPQQAYGAAFPDPAFTTDTYAAIQDTKLTFQDFGGYFPANKTTYPTVTTNGDGTKTVDMVPKTIQELFDDYGRMNATLGVELPFTNFNTQTTVPLGYVDPPTEGKAVPTANPLINNFPGAVPIHAGDTQIWKITHNGVDTHTIHFHLVNVQLINRVGWDGAIRPPDANEIGWKESVRMHPLEDAIVAAQFKLPTTTPAANPQVPFAVLDSKRYLNPTMPYGSPQPQFAGIEAATGNGFEPVNELNNFGWEYVWHCHLLGHEENDMMRAIVVNKP